MEVEVKIPAEPPRFVLECPLQGGVHVCASHPQVGQVYWRVFDNSDLEGPDTFSLTMDVSEALRLPVNWRNHWYYGPKYEFLADEAIAEDVEFCDNGLNEYIPRLNGALYCIAQHSGLSAEDLLKWLLSAEWQDVPAGTAASISRI
ncbi:hypothetical protein [Achromobacter anxifer]|uniref:hypothetical protein n=1 Tax=Achromobacter anxifer TaxID=1287737 RepID=UPI0023F77409|nr:hypothetical protein [Achromobacter anxifer]MDF8364720.1 hypothetical protein [Achromobacter anxifer]